ncbi:DUF1543 domain-containing protein [Candidatus Berkiella aquae]|uniref:DUF1543 domain-containing protein n=1 Tax=Candidatus Berkiella aquae TaxID=295108 RepID=A0A0Q9YP30_9GAMM|nr:DUF1543 domain-containing protein [Candidatus Berkiella aquae]MCS5711601.1 DUF1543 domain-containing protein [Candidatus Berkiella aquae]
MLKLYAVLLGGRAPGCHIELHDVVFAIGESLEALYPQLVNQWFGKITKSLHIDSSVELKYVDGHEVVIREYYQKQEGDKTLYFANFGGYQEGLFGEKHETNFYVATSRIDGLARAKEELCVGMLQQHSDDHLSVDDILAVEHIGPYTIELIPTTKPCHLTIESYYRKLTLPDILEKAEALKVSA